MNTTEDIPTTKTAEILLVEDNRGDVVLFSEALRRWGWKHHLSHASDGEEAMDFLRRRGRFSDAPVPDLIVLDLNLPIMSGRDVLKEIRPDPVLGQIAVVILTTSSTDCDVVQAFGLLDGAYFVKPAAFGDYADIIDRMKELWLRTESNRG
jgi:CheY-like chemotaxis protein